MKPTDILPFLTETGSVGAPLASFGTKAMACSTDEMILS